MSVRYGDDDALIDLSLDVVAGERFAIMGPSGSGKSTLLRAIAGIVPSAGTITIAGEDVSSMPTHQRPIGLMFQDFALFPHMTVAENVAYGLRMQGVSGSERVDAATGLLSLVGLAGYGQRDPSSLSGGEQQRVALARTLAPQPKLLMLDEPLGSLDLALRERLLEHTRSLVEEVGVTTLYVTHDRGEAFAFADRLAVLIDGRVAAVGTPSDVWSGPGSVEVARLIGHPNVMDSFPGFEGPVSIPFDAVRLEPSGDVEGTIIDSIFDDGGYIVALAIEGADAPLHVKVDDPKPKGNRVSISIDEDKAIALEGDQTASAV